MADDIANEVFLELWRQAPAFEGRSEVSTWLLGIARFKALSALRKKQGSAGSTTTTPRPIPDTSDTPEVAVMKDDKADRAAAHGQRAAGRAPHGHRPRLLPRANR